jgi:arylsulfatase A-like enzyme
VLGWLVFATKQPVAAGTRRCLLCLLGALGIVACGTSEPPNVVLVTLDTTRADHLGCYGYDGDTSPNLDRFAEQAILYERAYSTSSWTAPSHASIFTGLLPMQHGADVALDTRRLRPLGEELSTLAELLAEAGYRTAGVVSGPALRRDLGFAQGFEIYDDGGTVGLAAIHGKRAKRAADQAIAHLERFAEEPYFLFVNFYDPHAPYRPPPPHDSSLPPATAKDPTPRLIALLKAGVPPVPVESLDLETRTAYAGIVAGYDAEIRYMDHHLGRLLDAIAVSPRSDETLIIITGDHGESFGEHYYFGHTLHLYEDNVRVPLLVRPPGTTEARRVTEPVQNHRVFASILAEAGIDMPPQVAVRRLDETGGIVLTELRSNHLTVRLFDDPSFHRDLRAIYGPPYKLVEAASGAVELFDIERDPDELANLASEEPELVKTLSERMNDFVERHPPLYVQDMEAELQPDTEKALRALGYIE